METASSSSRPHALVLPLPAQGHINPLLNFSLHLASRGFGITFLNTQEAQNRMKCLTFMETDDVGLQVRFATIPGGYQEPPALGVAGHDIQKLRELLDDVASQQGTMEDMVVTSRDSSHPITCIISDSFFPWTQSLANKLGIKRVIFWTTSGMSLASTLEMRSGKFVLPNDVVGGDDVDDTTGGVTFKRSEFLAAMPFRRNPQILDDFKTRLSGCEHAACFVVNTFKELEASSLEASICETRVHYVGPILPPTFTKNVTRSASLYQEDSSCLCWLDKQRDGSVLYISFGSLFYLSQGQMEELAAGLEETKQPFLWVIRDGHNALPEGFTKRTSYGLVISWAPQTEVLGHVAVGGFLTHCGWNSVMESIHMGVPMLGYPLFGDQPINALLIAKKWKLGVVMQKGQDGVVHRDIIHKALLELMHSKEIRESADRMKAASHCAIQEGGSSYEDLQNVILDLMEGA